MRSCSLSFNASSTLYFITTSLSESNDLWKQICYSHLNERNKSLFFSHDITDGITEADEDKRTQKYGIFCYSIELLAIQSPVALVIEWEETLSNSEHIYNYSSHSLSGLNVSDNNIIMMNRTPPSISAPRSPKA